MYKRQVGDEKTGSLVLGMVVIYVIAVIIGFLTKKPAPIAVETTTVSESETEVYK